MSSFFPSSSLASTNSDASFAFALDSTTDSTVISDSSGSTSVRQVSFSPSSTLTDTSAFRPIASSHHLHPRIKFVPSPSLSLSTLADSHPFSSSLLSLVATYVRPFSPTISKPPSSSAAMNPSRGSGSRSRSRSLQVVLHPTYTTGPYRWARTLIFLSLGCSAVIPVTHNLLRYGWERAQTEMGLSWLLGSGGL